MNEFDFIKRLREQTGTRRHSARVITGIGDDGSVIRQSPNRDLIVTTDLLVEDVDFHRDATPPRLLGHKALAVSLSDIAAMGARPFCSFLSIGMPRDIWNDWFRDEFIAGFLALADQFGVTLAGGDVSETREGIVIDSIVLGEVGSGSAILRSGARPGDQIFVTGNLGGAAAGLKLIEKGARVDERSEVRGQRSERNDQRGTSPTNRGPRAGSPRGVVDREGSDTEPGAVATGPESEPRLVGVATDQRDTSPTNRGPRAGSPRGVVDREGSDTEPPAVAGGPESEPRLVGVATGSSRASDDDAIQSLLLRQLRPSPRVGWGIVLGEEHLATAMIDMSDGLSSDLKHLCTDSNVGATIDAASIPIDNDVKKLCGRRALDPLALALHGGEDFELLFTVAPESVARLPKRVDGVAISRIGEITNTAGIIRIREKNREWDLHLKGFVHFEDLSSK